MYEADTPLIAILQKALPDKLIILLPSPDTAEVNLFYSGLQAIVQSESDPPTFIIQSIRTSAFLGWGQEATLTEAIVSAYAAMRRQAAYSSDDLRAA